MTFEILAARGLTEDAMLNGAIDGATLRAGTAGVSFHLPFLDKLIGTGGADLSTGGAGLGTTSGALTARG